jgi:polysaccharide biosynthesis transport protein
MEVRTEDKSFAPNPEVKLHFLDYWRILRIRKTVILAVFLLVALTTTVVTYILPETFASMVRISIERDITDVPTGLEGGDTAYRSASSYDPFALQTEFQRIKSRPVLTNVVERLNLREEWMRKYKFPGPLSPEDAYQILSSRISVEQPHNSTLVEIHARSEDKDEAARLANAVADIYAEVRIQARNRVTEGGVKKLREELVRYDDRVAQMQSNVNSLRLASGISDYEADQPTPRLDQETLRKIDNQRIEAESVLSRSSSLYNSLAPLSRDELKKVAPVAISRDTLLTDLLAREHQAEEKLSNLKGLGYGDDHSEVRAVTETLRSVRTHLNDRLDGLLPAIKSQMETDRVVVEGYRKEVEKLRDEDRNNYARTRPYYDAKDELRRVKAERDRLQLTVNGKVIEMNLPKRGSVDVIDPAVPNKKPVKPNKKLVIPAGVVGGLILGILLAFFIEYLDTSVKTIDDVERALQAPVLGVIPQNVGLLIDEGPESPHGEAYRVLRTNVLFSRKDPKLNTVTVVSGGAGEGKSTTIFNLATVFAQNGQRVLVVDSDLRRPSLHKFLKISNSIGLTDFLLRRNTLEEVIQRTNMPTMDFLPSGRLPSSSLGILSSVQMKELIRDLKRRYDFVFFDSPPIMGVSDASILASEVDMVLQVIQYRRYPQPMTIRAKQMIEKVGGNLLGIVLNNINMSQDENYYYYSGYYYDYYQKGEYASGEKKSKREKSEEAATADAGKVEIKSKF